MSCHGCCCSPAMLLPFFITPTMPLQAGSCEFVCNFPTSPVFSHHSLFQLNCYSIHDAAHQPSVDKVNKHCHPMLASHSRVERAMMESFPLFFYFHHTIPHFFSYIPFSIKLLSCWPCRPPILSRQGK